MFFFWKKYNRILSPSCKLKCKSYTDHGLWLSGEGKAFSRFSVLFIFIRKLAKLHTQAHLREIQFYPFINIFLYDSLTCFIQESNDNIMLCLYGEKLFHPTFYKNILFVFILNWINRLFFNPFKQNSSVWFSSFSILFLKLESFLYVVWLSCCIERIEFWSACNIKEFFNLLTTQDIDSFHYICMHFLVLC